MVGFGLIFTSIGIALAPPVFGFVVEQTSSYTVGWLVLALIYAVGLGLLSRVREPR